MEYSQSMFTLDILIKLNVDQGKCMSVKSMTLNVKKKIQFIEVPMPVQ